eukprot:703724-Pyramimonas_sp.AAC.1
MSSSPRQIRATRQTALTTTPAVIMWFSLRANFDGEIVVALFSLAPLHHCHIHPLYLSHYAN